jgi:hypothetical protein
VALKEVKEWEEARKHKTYTGAKCSVTACWLSVNAECFVKLLSEGETSTQRPVTETNTVIAINVACGIFYGGVSIRIIIVEW